MLFTALRAPSRCGVTPHILPRSPRPRPPSMSQALAEKWNWLGADYESDPFGSLLLERGRAKKRPEARVRAALCSPGVTSDSIGRWKRNPVAASPAAQLGRAVPHGAGCEVKLDGRLGKRGGRRWCKAGRESAFLGGRRRSSTSSRTWPWPQLCVCVCVNGPRSWAKARGGHSPTVLLLQGL